MRTWRARRSAGALERGRAGCGLPSGDGWAAVEDNAWTEPTGRVVGDSDLSWRRAVARRFALVSMLSGENASLRGRVGRTKELAHDFQTGLADRIGSPRPCTDESHGDFRIQGQSEELSSRARAGWSAPSTRACAVFGGGPGVRVGVMRETP